MRTLQVQIRLGLLIALFGFFLSPTVYSQCPSSISAIAKPSDCTADNGQVDVNISANGYRGSFIFEIVGMPGKGKMTRATASGNQPKHTFKNLAPGSYHVAVVLQEGCQNLLDNVNVHAGNLRAVAEGSKGAADLQIEGGTKPYVIEWSDGGIGTEARRGLTAGIYEAHVTDAGGCYTVVKNIVVN